MLVTLKIMPDSADTDLKEIREKVKDIVLKQGGELLDKDETVPIAFGLMALKLMFIIDESKGSDAISDEVASMDGVSSSTVVDMRRTVG